MDRWKRDINYFCNSHWSPFGKLLHSNRVEKTGCVFNSEKTQWVHRAIYTSQIGLYICVIDHKLVHIL
jgi:hypothetical protein